MLLIKIVLTIIIFFIFLVQLALIMKNNNNYIYDNNDISIIKMVKLINKNKLLFNNNIDFFSISIYKSNYEKNNYMFIIRPQNYHFFLENDKFIYHPKNKHLDGLLKQYYCHDYNNDNNNTNNNNNDNDNEKEFELAYNLLPLSLPPPSSLSSSQSLIPKIICHKKLKYLKLYIYKEMIYYKVFYNLQNPINAINDSINDIIYKFSH